MLGFKQNMKIKPCLSGWHIQLEEVAFHLAQPTVMRDWVAHRCRETADAQNQREALRHQPPGVLGWRDACMCQPDKHGLNITTENMI